MTGLPYFLPTTLPGGSDTYAITSSALGGSDGSLEGIEFVCASAQALILSQYKDKPLIAGWLCSYLDRIQELDTATVSLIQNVLDLENAKGVHLDLLGRIVREARDGTADDTYRRALRVRILINRSQGRIEDLIEIASLFEDDAPIRLREFQPARITVEVQAVPINAADRVHVRLRRAKAAGVALQTITHPAASADTRFFTLGAGAASFDKTELLTGLGWTGDDRGGALSHVLA